MKTTTTRTTCVGLLLAGALGLAGCGGNADGAATSATDGGTQSAPPPAPSAGEILFEDSLDDDSQEWGVVDNAEVSLSYQDGDYVWQSKVENLRPHLLPSPLGEAYDRGELDMLDVVIRAEVTPVQGESAMAVFCREVPDVDADFKWYEFAVRDGYAAIRIADLAGELEVLATTEDLSLPAGEQATVEAACVDDEDGNAQLWLTVNDTLVLFATDDDPLGNGAPGLGAYDAPESASPDRFVIRWHEFTVFQATN